MAPPQGVRETIEECEEDMGSEANTSATTKIKSNELLLLTLLHLLLSHIHMQPTDNNVLDDVVRCITFDGMELDREIDFGNIDGRNLDSSVVMHEEVLVSEVPNDHLVIESDTHVEVELVVDEARTEEQVVKQFNGDEQVEVQCDVEGIDNAYDTQYNGDSSEDVGMDDEEEVLAGEDVDVVNVDGFDSKTGCEDEVGFKRRKKLKELIRGMENRVLNDIARINTIGTKVNVAGLQLLKDLLLSEG
ncbi:hypothetical protein Tco_0865455 [Tanacetum coccineum]